MNKLKIGFAVAFATAATFACGQSYSLYPADSIVANAPFDDLTHFNILQNNLTEDSLTLSWQQISLDIPIGWTGYLCDNGQCYIDFPNSGTMNTVYSGEYGLMAVGINPLQIEGTAFIQYTVWDQNFPAQVDTLTWVIDASGVSKLYISETDFSFNIFPNIAYKNITISTNLKDGFQYMIFDLNGKLVVKGNSFSNIEILPVENFANGNYTISIFNKIKVFTTKKFIIQH